MYLVIKRANGETIEIGGARMIYFIQSVSGGPIKIGSSRDVSRRLSELQTASPTELRVIYQTRGDFDTEMELHALFDRERLSGEWFSPSHELIEFIEQLRAGECATFGAGSVKL